jgi:hypothetical protein
MGLAESKSELDAEHVRTAVEHARKGVPAEDRAHVWYQACEAHLKKSRSDRTYQQYVADGKQSHMAQIQEARAQISLDVTRRFLDDERFPVETEYAVRQPFADIPSPSPRPGANVSAGETGPLLESRSEPEGRFTEHIYDGDLVYLALCEMGDDGKTTLSDVALDVHDPSWQGNEDGTRVVCRRSADRAGHGPVQFRVHCKTDMSADGYRWYGFEFVAPGKPRADDPAGSCAREELARRLAPYHGKHLFSSPLSQGLFHGRFGGGGLYCRYARFTRGECFRPAGGGLWVARNGRYLSATAGMVQMVDGRTRALPLRIALAEGCPRQLPPPRPVPSLEAEARLESLMVPLENVRCWPLVPFRTHKLTRCRVFSSVCGRA